MSPDYASKTTEELKALASNYEERINDSAAALSVATARAICGAIRRINDEIRRRDRIG